MPIVDQVLREEFFCRLRKATSGGRNKGAVAERGDGGEKKRPGGCKVEEEVSFCRSSNWKIVLFFTPFGSSPLTYRAIMEMALWSWSLSLYFFLPQEQAKSQGLSLHPALWHDSVLPSICSPSFCLMWKWPSGKKDWIEEWQGWRINCVGTNTQNAGSQRDPGCASNMWGLIKFRLVALTTLNCAEAMEISPCICR